MLQAERERAEAERARDELEKQFLQLQKEMSDQKAEVELKRMDTNKDHVVDKEEFKSAGGTDEEFDRYDTNKDRKLDAGEMEQRAADKVEERERARVARAGLPGLSWRGEMLNNTTVCLSPRSLQKELTATRNTLNRLAHDHEMVHRDLLQTRSLIEDVSCTFAC